MEPGPEPMATGQPPPVTPAGPFRTAGAGYILAADEAARSFDYETALNLLDKALAEGVPADQAALLQRRMVLYARFLGMTNLVELARENPGRLVGGGTTRGGQQLWGLVQVFELGVTPGAGIGNRLPNQGSFTVRVADGSTRTVAAWEVAQVQVTWTPPAEGAPPRLWTVEKLEILLQDGQVVVGAPTWSLAFSSFWVRPPGAEEDVSVSCFPMSDREPRPDDLASELIIVGAPPLTPAAPTSAPETEERPTTPAPSGETGPPSGGTESGASSTETTILEPEEPSLSEPAPAPPEADCRGASAPV